MKVSLALSALLLLAPAVSHGKCLDDFYRVKGIVVLANGKPAAGAIVGVSWVESGRPSGPAIATSDSKGNFTAFLHFHRHSGIGPRGDECDGVLREVAVRAYTASHQSMSFRFHLKVKPAGIIQLGVVPISFKRDGL